MARSAIDRPRTRRPQIETLEPRLPLSGDPLVLDPDQVGWASVRNLTSAAFSADFAARKDDNIMLDIEVDEINGQQRVSAVWQSNTDNRGWAEHRNLTHQQFSDTWQQYRDAGYRLIDQESYVLGGNRYYAGIWIDNVENYGWASYRNLTSAEFSDYFQQYKDDYLMIDFEAYTVGNSTRYAAAWVENAGNLAWIERRDLTSAQFSDYFDQYKDFYRVHDIESYQVGGEQRYAAIWVENENNRGWAEYRDMDANQYRNRWLHMRDLGYRMTDFEQYELAGSIRYAGVWRQNSDRPDWQLRTTIDSLAASHLNQYDVPGMSVAIVHEGEILYMRGFGDQDVANDKWYSARTVNRLASVSKAVAGVLMMELAEQGDLDPNADTRDYVPDMPNHHTHTLAQLASNRGGVGHYGAHGLGNVNTQYDTAEEAAELFWNDPLIASPGAYNYSTHGYTLLGAGLEGATGQSVDDLLVDELGAGIGLSSLMAEDRSVYNEFRTTLYGTDNSVATPDNISWKILGGGMEASAYDMIRLSSQLMAGQILSGDALEQLWTAPDGVQYAMGWNLGTQQGAFSARKLGEQRGANTHLRVFPDMELGIVVLSNRRDTQPQDLTFDIAEAILPTIILPGDYNDDGIVNAGDYIVWRNSEGVETSLVNRGPDGAGVVDDYDYQVWRENYGNTLPGPPVRFIPGLIDDIEGMEVKSDYLVSPTTFGGLPPVAAHDFALGDPATEWDELQMAFSLADKFSPADKDEAQQLLLADLAVEEFARESTPAIAVWSTVGEQAETEQSSTSLQVNSPVGYEVL